MWYVWGPHATLKCQFLIERSSKVLLLYIPKASKTILHYMAGLLTYPILECLPRTKIPVAKSFKDTYGDLQQRVCSGLSPDSLFITPLPCGEDFVSHKTLQRYKLFLSHKNHWRHIYYLQIGILSEMSHLVDPPILGDEGWYNIEELSKKQYFLSLLQEELKGEYLTLRLDLSPNSYKDA